MYRTTLSALALSGLAACALSPADTGGINPADTAAPHPDDAAKAKAAAKTAAANTAAADANGDGKLRYRIVAEFHDTTTGRPRKKGRTVLADEDRAAQLIAAGVVDPTPVDEDAADEDADEGDNADAGTNTNAVAPGTVGGVVDEAVIVEGGAGATVTDDVPAVITGRKAAK